MRGTATQRAPPRTGWKKERTGALGGVLLPQDDPDGSDCDKYVLFKQHFKLLFTFE